MNIKSKALKQFPLYGYFPCLQTFFKEVDTFCSRCNRIEQNLNILRLPDAKSQFIGKDPDDGKD